MLNRVPKFIRGTTLRFTASFNDLGDAYTPSGATIRFAYAKDGLSIEEEFAMTLDGGTFIFTLDTTLLDRGSVDWNIRSDDVEQEALQEGKFTLFGNAANPEPEPAP